MGGNELAWRRMMKALKLRQTDLNGDGQDAGRASLARNGYELAKLLDDAKLEPRDRIAAVRELRQLTEKFIGVAPKAGEAKSGADGSEDDFDDWDTPSSG